MANQCITAYHTLIGHPILPFSIIRPSVLNYGNGYTVNIFGKAGYQTSNVTGTNYTVSRYPNRGNVLLDLADTGGLSEAVKRQPTALPPPSFARIETRAGEIAAGEIAAGAEQQQQQSTCSNETTMMQNAETEVLCRNGAETPASTSNKTAEQ